MSKQSLFALYRGDEFIDVGTARELSEKHSISTQSIYWMATPANHKRDRGNRLLAIRLED